MLASTKHWHRQNIRVDKILASTKYWRRQNLGSNKMLAHVRKHFLTDFSQTSLMFSYFSLKMLISPHAVTKCAVAAGRPAFMGGLSTALYRLIVPARHAENVTNIGVDKILAPAKISLIFTKLQQSPSLLTCVLSKIGKNKK